MFIKNKELTAYESELIIRSVLNELTDCQIANLLGNINSGRQINCGPRSYIFADENSGCMLTLASGTDWPVDQFDFKKKRIIESAGIELYNDIINKFTMKYYHAMQKMTHEKLKSIIVSHIRAA